MSVKKEEIHELLQSTREDIEGLEGAVLIKWAMVLDWVSPDGKRFVTRSASEGTPHWDRDGLFKYASQKWD